MQYSQRELVVGRLYGIRSFAVTRNGFLDSPVFGEMDNPPITSGVNTSVCHCKEMHEDEDKVSLRSSCGFYAYFQGGDMAFKFPGSITGIIAGSGNMVVGSRGFRAENMRVLGLVEPTFVTIKDLSAKEICKAYPVLPLCLAGMFTTALTRDFLQWIVMFALLAFLLWAAIFSMYSQTVYVYKHRKDFAQQVEAIKKRYPNAMWFETEEEACHAFNLPYVEEERVRGMEYLK